jgi:hypothetical protein
MDEENDGVSDMAEAGREERKKCSTLAVTVSHCIQVASQLSLA